MGNPINKVEEVATKLLSGILSNPNYNFENAKKAADIAVNHAEALVNKLAAATKIVAQKVEDAASSVKSKASEIKKKTSKKEDPLGK